MSGGGASGRARANHELYLARLVLGGWYSSLDQQATPAHILAQAYGSGVREHLVRAYGWFLLSVAGGPYPPEGPPRSCDDLPPAPPGQVLPEEINEFRQLEKMGWIADMLQDSPTDLPERRVPDNLATTTGNLPDYEQMARWSEQLEVLFSRMGDSLDEY